MWNPKLLLLQWFRNTWEESEEVWKSRTPAKTGGSLDLEGGPLAPLMGSHRRRSCGRQFLVLAACTEACDPHLPNSQHPRATLTLTKHRPLDYMIPVTPDSENCPVI